MMWKKNKRYHVPQKTFNENMAERRKVGEVKKDGNYLDVLFVVHALNIEMGWINASFFRD